MLYFSVIHVIVCVFLVYVLLGNSTPAVRSSVEKSIEEIANVIKIPYMKEHLPAIIRVSIILRIS